MSQDKDYQIYNHGKTIGELSNTIPCINFIVGAPPGQYKVFNSCSSCKIVTIAWSSGEIQDIRLQGGQSEQGRVRGEFGQMVREVDC